MERRSFLAGLGALIGGVALDAAVPFGRVYSFPSEIIPIKGLNFYDITSATKKFIVPRLLDSVFQTTPIFWKLSSGVEVELSADTFSFPVTVKRKYLPMESD